MFHVLRDVDLNKIMEKITLIRAGVQNLTKFDYVICERSLFLNCLYILKISCQKVSKFGYEVGIFCGDS